MVQASITDIMKFVNSKNAEKPLESLINHGCEYFSNKAESPTYGYKVNSGEASLTYITPMEYLAKCQNMQGIEGTLNNYIKKAILKSTARKYSKDMKNGDLFPIPVLDYELGIQEGRHRAYAAYLLGSTKIPVILVNKKDIYEEDLEDIFEKGKNKGAQEWKKVKSKKF